MLLPHLVPGPAEFGTVNPDTVHDHGQPARQRHDRFLSRGAWRSAFGVGRTNAREVHLKHLNQSEKHWKLGTLKNWCSMPLSLPEIKSGRTDDAILRGAARQ